MIKYEKFGARDIGEIPETFSNTSLTTKLALLMFVLGSFVVIITALIAPFFTR